MEIWPQGDYLKKAKEQSVPESTAQAAWEQASSVQQNDLPAVLTLNHLSKLADVSCKSMRAIVCREVSDPYRAFQMRKRGAGKSYRHICVPKPDLLRVQRWIDRAILSKLTPHPAARAYSSCSSIIATAKEHSGCRWLIKLDVRRFFESISEIQVYRVFSSAGYQPLIAFQMARLCTRVVKSKKRYRLSRWQSTPHLYKLFGCEWLGHLPQGAPTSPRLSNLTSKTIDDNFSFLAAYHEFTYSRYADDIFLSRFDEFSRDRAGEVIRDGYEILRGAGMRPHTLKTRVCGPGSRKIVLGLCVNETVPKLTRVYKNELKTNVRFICENDVQTQAKHRGFTSAYGFRNHILGKINFAKQIEPAFAENQLRHLAKSETWNEFNS